MRHELTLQGQAFGLRPVRDADAAFILALRSNPALNQHLHATSPRLEDQLAWLAAYDERAGDYYFVIERLGSGQAEGVIAIYDLDEAAGLAEWGRWILQPGSWAAVESAALIYQCAFQQLGLRSLYCRTVAENAQVVSFHDSCGITDRRLLPAHFELHGLALDAIEHHVSAQSWPSLAARLAPLCKLTARRMGHVQH